MANHPWVIVLQFVFINCLHTSSAFFLGSTRVALRKGHISPSRWDVAPQTSSLDSSGSSGLGGSLSYIAGGFPQRDFSTSRASLAVQNEDHNKRNRNDPLRLMDVFQEVETFATKQDSSRPMTPDSAPSVEEACGAQTDDAGDMPEGGSVDGRYTHECVDIDVYEHDESIISSVVSNVGNVHMPTQRENNRGNEDKRKPSEGAGNAREDPTELGSENEEGVHEIYGRENCEKWVRENATHGARVGANPTTLATPCSPQESFYKTTRTFSSKMEITQSPSFSALEGLDEPGDEPGDETEDEMSTRYHDIVHAALDPDLSHPSFFGAVQDEFAYVGERACVTPDRPTPTPDSATTHAQDSFPSNRAHADVQHIVNNVMRELFHDALSGRQPRQSLDEHGLEDAMETVVSKALYEALSGGGRSRDTGIDEKRMEESFAQMKIEVAASSDYHPSDLVSSAVPWEDATSAQGEDDDDTTDIRIDNEASAADVSRYYSRTPANQNDGGEGRNKRWWGGIRPDQRP